MTITPRQMQAPMSSGFNGNVGGYGVGSYAPSTSGMSLAQQPNMNMNVNMNNNMNMMEGGHEFHQLDVSDVDFINRLTSEDAFDSNSGSDNPEGGSGDDQAAEANQAPGAKRKRYHRHTQHQIQEMENFFKECPHPDDKQRKELGRELGLAPLQVKFWFQNKRTQVKTQHERNENQMLRNENEKLRIDIIRLQEAMARACCVNCGGQAVVPEMSNEEQALRIENARLKEEIDRLSGLAARYVGRPFMRYTNGVPTMVPHLLNPVHVNFARQMPMVGDVDLFRTITGPSEVERSMIIELVVDSMDELMRMAQMDAPLWIPSIDGTTTLLNHQEYFGMFSRVFGLPPHGFKFEASRKTAVITMNHVNLVEMLMNVNQWSTFFSSIVSRAITVEVLSTGTGGNHNGALHLIVAEFQLATPIVPTRSNYFARYCKQHANGVWAVVDVSLEDLRPGEEIRFRHRPSGCLIQEMSNGYSKVTWVEHVEVDDRVVHQLYKPLVNSGLAFGAQRWIGTLDRHCERLASASASIPSSDLVNMGIANQEARRSMIKLAERIVKFFHQGVSSTFAHTWTMLAGTGVDDVRVMSKKCADEPGRPRGVALCAATSFWVPASPKTIFDFLSEVSTRHEWDILTNDGKAEEIAHIANGREADNCISLYRITSTNPGRDNMIIVQETCTDESGSYVIYAPVDNRSINTVLAGLDSEFVSILPSGVAILPDGTGGGGNGDIGGSLLTVAFQLLVDSDPTAKLSLSSIATVNGLITCTVDRIKTRAMIAYNAFLLGNNAAQLAGNNAGPNGPMM